MKGFGYAAGSNGLRHLGVIVGKVLQNHQRLAQAVVFHQDTGLGGAFGHEVLIGAEIRKAQQRWRFAGEGSKAAMTLYHQSRVACGVFQ